MVPRASSRETAPFVYRATERSSPTHNLISSSFFSAPSSRTRSRVWPDTSYKYDCNRASELPRLDDVHEDETDDAQELPDDYSLLDLHAFFTRTLAEGDARSRAILREQLIEEEFHVGD